MRHGLSIHFKEKRQSSTQTWNELIDFMWWIFIRCFITDHNVWADSCWLCCVLRLSWCEAISACVQSGRRRWCFFCEAIWSTCSTSMCVKAKFHGCSQTCFYRQAINWLKERAKPNTTSIYANSLRTVFMTKIYEWLLPNLLLAVLHKINFVDILNYNQNHASWNYRSNIPFPLPA